jgi:hypothetical protein
MRFLEMGVVFAAVGFVVANTVISLLIVLLWRAAEPAPRRSGSLFLMRMLPAIVSTALMLGLVVPAFWSFEPRATAESPGLALVALAFVALALVATGIRRAVASWLETRRLEGLWKRAAASGASLGIPVRAYLVPSELPLAALIGDVRPRLFVSSQFLASLSADERKAVFNHEAGHMLSLDNLKRTLMRLAPDWLSFSSVGREIEAAWAIAAEEEADDHSVGPDRAGSLDLAGALLKAARLTPVRPAPASNFYDGATVARRVARLLEDQPDGRPKSALWAPRFAGLLALLAAAALFSGPSLRAAYVLTEAAVRLLQ